MLLLFLTAMLSWSSPRGAQSALAEDSEGANTIVAAAQQALHRAQQRYQQQPGDLDTALNLARACFELADLPVNSSLRAEVAQQGIDAAERALRQASNSAAAHYYLGLNQGELARTETLGALRLVRRMEGQFLAARALDSSLDYAGPDRCLALLYRDAPSFGSIGSRSKAREHLQQAVALAPNYPDNQLNLIESELKWGQRDRARKDLEAFQATLPAERARFSGAAWAASWVDWDARLQALQRQIEGQQKKLETPRAKG